MKTSLFDFELPEALIASHPASPRDASRMLVIRDGIKDAAVADIADYLHAGDVLVLNDTKVIPARLYGKRGAAKVEVVLHKHVIASVAKQSRKQHKESWIASLAMPPRNDESIWFCFAKPGKKLKPGDKVDFAQGFYATVKAKQQDGQVILQFNCDDAALRKNLESYGHMPLPPYIEKIRHADETDSSHYQTVYAKHEGSVAAPTAGLHFTPELLEKIRGKGVKIVHATLHVGGGTFLPVKVEDTKDHVMHSEWAQVTAETADAINEAKQRGNRIIAVGTTALRTLESATTEGGTMMLFDQETDIFITPGYRFKTVDILLTNFHLPRSTLFMLVCAFSGMGVMKQAYSHAIAQKYRFFSYGDACLLYRKDSQPV